MPATTVPQQESGNCPGCGTSLIGSPIPEASREHYGNKTHFRREIGFETDGYDGVAFWCCPDCHVAWPRFTGDNELGRWSASEAADHNRKVDLLRDKKQVEATLIEHAQMVWFAVRMAGLTWRGWLIDPRAGAVLYLMVDGDIENVQVFLERLDQAGALVGDVTGLPVSLMLPNSPSAWQFDAAVVQPPPPLVATSSR